MTNQMHNYPKIQKVQRLNNKNITILKLFVQTYLTEEEMLSARVFADKDERNSNDTVGKYLKISLGCF